jgi:nonsense-mediated mRNA decay protein 3
VAPGKCPPCIAASAAGGDALGAHLPATAEVQRCRDCGRYCQPPQRWVYCDWESKELLSLCLKRLRGLSKVKLVDACFIWTEPHSKRIQLKLTVQQEVFPGTVLQQQRLVTFTIINLQCRLCERAAHRDTWQSTVQLRQRAPTRRTFLYLEQLILRQGLHKTAVGIKGVSGGGGGGGGLDFFFADKKGGAKLVQFVQANAMCAKAKLTGSVTGFAHGVGTSKSATALELCPVCKEDLVVLPRAAAGGVLGGRLGQLALVTRAARTLRLVDPTTGSAAELGGQAFWKHPFEAVLGAPQLVEYTVLDSDYGDVEGFGGGDRGGGDRGRFAVAMVEVARTADLGANDRTASVRTHLGAVLRPGDLAFGYDLAHATVEWRTAGLASAGEARLPEVVLVRKKFRVGKRAGRRRWRVKRMVIEEEEGGFRLEAADKRQAALRKAEQERFLQELEEDPGMRAQVALFKVREKRGTGRREQPAADAEDAAAGVGAEAEADGGKAKRGAAAGKEKEKEKDGEAEDEEEEEDEEDVAAVAVELAELESDESASEYWDSDGDEDYM